MYVTETGGREGERVVYTCHVPKHQSRQGLRSLFCGCGVIFCGKGVYALIREHMSPMGPGPKKKKKKYFCFFFLFL